MNTTPHAAAVRAAESIRQLDESLQHRHYIAAAQNAIHAEYHALVEAAEALLSMESHHCYDHQKSENDPCDMCCAANNLRAELARVKGES